ncbi:MAG: hypothetical protein FWE35_26620 [Streptosporangiales bacterium]|nr:hypothetical protein [Streptosporangiales bacterium]
MIHVAGPTTIFWTVAMGMGFAVLAVVIVLLNLLLKSARALDTRVDNVAAAALGVHAHTAIAGPQLSATEQQLTSAVAALRGPAPRPAPPRPATPQFGVPGPQFRPAAPPPRPAPQFTPPAPSAPAQPAAPVTPPSGPATRTDNPTLPRFPRDTGPQRRPSDPRFPTSLPPVPPAPEWEPGQNPRRPE